MKKTIIAVALLFTIGASFGVADRCMRYDKYSAAASIQETEHVHQPGKWNITVQPSCTEDGMAVHVCETCGDEYETKTVYKTGHSGEWKVTLPATCTEMGEEQLICKKCGEILKTKKIPDTEHDYVWTTTKEASCKSEGEMELVCTDCQTVKKNCKKILPALGHDYKDCVCKRCGYRTNLDEQNKKIFLTKEIVKEAGIVLSGDVVIPESVVHDNQTYTVIGIGCALCMYNKDITSVTLPDTIQYIDEYAFDFCENMTSCNLPDSITTIGEAAFQCCFSLQDIHMPSSLKELGNFAFNHCSKVQNTEINIPDSIELLGKFKEAPSHMFYDFGTDAFTKFTAENNKHGYIVDNDILYAENGKTLVSIPRGKTFADNVYVMPDTVVNLGELSFSRNKNIYTVVISDNLNITGKLSEKERQSFNSYGNQLSLACYVYNDITEYQVKQTNKKYISIDGVLYTKDKKNLIAIPNQYTGVLEIPDGVQKWQTEALWTDIEDFVDLSMDKITEIHIPESLTEIDEKQIETINKIVDYYGTRVLVNEHNTKYCVDAYGHVSLK